MSNQPSTLTATPNARSARCLRCANREQSRAIAQMENVKGFYIHLLVLLIVMPGLIALNFLISPDAMWFNYVLAPWLLALAMQAALTFPILKLFGWQRKVWRRISQALLALFSVAVA